MKTFTGLVFAIIVYAFSCYGFASNQSSGLKVGSCGHENIKISYEITADYLLACEGIVRAKKFFTTHGYAVDTPITIFFNHQIIVNHPICGSGQVYGYFDPKDMSVYISSLISQISRAPEEVHFKTKFQPGFMLQEYHISAVVHEISHLFAQHNFNIRNGADLDCSTMGHGVHEYIATLVQLSSMESTLLQHILREYAPEVTFTHEQQINEILFACAPEKFAIMSYRHFNTLNPLQQQIFLDRIFSGNLNPDKINIDF